MFNKWFRNRKKRIVSVEIVGRDEDSWSEAKAEEKRSGGPIETSCVRYVELVFNKYLMEMPVYREMIRLMELKFKICRQSQTIINWLLKVSKNLKHLIPVLKENGYPTDKIKEERHDARSMELITEMRMELTRLLTTEEPKNYLLKNALNYFDNFWKSYEDTCDYSNISS